MRKIVVEYNGPHGYRPVEPMEGPPMEALPAKIEAATGGEDDVTKTASAADGEDDDWGDYATDKPKFLMTDLGNALIVTLFGEACDSHRGTPRRAGSGATRCDTAPR